MTRRARWLLAAGVLAALAAGGVALASGRSEPAGAGGALHLAEDAARFESSGEAADTFARIAGLLIDDARRCADEGAPGHARCVALAGAAAYVQAVAVEALRCTAPGVFELRTWTLDLLLAVERGQDGPPSPVAPIPSCR